MHHGGSGKVDIAVTKIQGSADLRHPTASPHPASGDGVKNGADGEFAEEESPEGDALTDGADDDVSGGFHKHDFEQRQTIAGTVVGGADKEKAFSSHESPEAASDQKLVEDGNATEVGGRGVNGDCSKLKCVADGVVGEEGEDVGGEIQHHQMSDIFLA